MGVAEIFNLTDSIAAQMHSADKVMAALDASLGEVRGPRGATPVFASDCCGSNNYKDDRLDNR